MSIIFVAGTMDTHPPSLFLKRACVYGHVM